MGKPDEKQLKQVFGAIDGDKSGKINTSELSKALKQVGMEMDDDTIKGMLDLIDTDSDGQMNFKEFMTFINVCENAEPENVGSILFYAADTDFSGKIDKKELKVILEKLGVKATDAQLSEVMAEVADKTGEITHDGFKALVEALSE
ncbi:EF_hand domain-containing protein [Hexamita inflata]|uniref:EF hand domain-containing protein n=2 Tax=Hexamita inflata TaxID=28002 RepID=A0AA86QI11_9EUKA|nr:EF hand domain-containing protein [Hexamita inflata]CAI9956736.1 EF hand domain-containing protein [Hexamita inflata]CAI9970954.1 EF hand domain-containing protein [Hexamita inflata]